ncbi:MAG: PilZ domain-containing protein [Firmicutes bacterium]|nr:PilZ domain-containing protein [Bacillota bacterium]
MPITIMGAVQQKKIALGKQVTIEDSHADVICRAEVVDIQGETICLRITPPAVQPLQKLKPETVVTLSFVVPDDGIYSFAAAVSSCQEDPAMVSVEQSTPLVRTEQRSDYRLKTSKIIYMLAEQPSGPLGQNWHEACLLDLSRGGASVLVAVALPVGTEISVWIPLDEVDHVLEATARVVRLKPGDQNQTVAGVCFTDLSLVDQEKILDYILKVWTEKKDAKQRT